MLTATVLALAAAALHAAWNLIAKVSDDRELALVGQFVVGGLLAAGAGLAATVLGEELCAGCGWPWSASADRGGGGLWGSRRDLTVYPYPSI